MKKYWFGVLAAVVIFFVSCYEINEEITLSNKGTGTYVTKMDMSAMLEMMKTMAGEEELSKNGLDRAIDTIIYMKDAMDSAKDLTAEQKKLYSDGVMKLQMDVAKNVLKADMKFPFKNYNDLQTLMSGSGTGGMSEIFRKIFSAKDTAQSAVPSQDQQGFDQINNVFDVTVTRNSIIKKLNRARYDSVMQKPEMAQAKQMIGSGFELLYTTTISLPRAAKKVDNPIVKLSADKKTVTIRYDMLKLFDTPEQFSYSITY
jgi:hypothetical protein